jgi:outer membrane receptor for ferrienterochelin and colicins
MKRRFLPGILTASILLPAGLNAQDRDSVAALIDSNVAGKALGEVVVSSTMKEISRSASAIPVEILTPALFRKNPTPSLFEAVGMINGVLPQINCNVCNTGDIHINGMEGPYTMILIDGMPVVSALSTVYGLSGIPNSLVERIEIVKGPAGALYGSEAMGGLINVITKNPARAPKLSFDAFATSWGEISVDGGLRYKSGKTTGLLGVNYFNYQRPIDKNGDGFTDMTLQHRISIFNKWQLTRKESRAASLAARYVYEDRWGGQMGWNRSWRGSDVIYGESIYTSRIELLGLYQLPFRERIFAQLSYNMHDQDSRYGPTSYIAQQQVGFAQLYWDKTAGGHSLLAGAAMRYTWYDDNTPATADPGGRGTQPAITPLPGVFVQDEWTINPAHKILAGYRFDYDRHHGGIQSPRLAWRWAPGRLTTIRTSFGTGFRVVNLFTEDHAALTGARTVVIEEALAPERSMNGNLNVVQNVPLRNAMLNLDVTGFYSHFSNKIIGDFDTDPDKIIYRNLHGYAVSRGASLNTELSLIHIPLRILAGVTYADVFQKRNGERVRQLHAPEWTGTFTASYSFTKRISADLSGRWCGPMRLPILPNDYRPEYSRWFLLANIQITYKTAKGPELYGGVKNLLNFVPKDPLMRPFDPFDRNVNDPVNNPNGYTFDPGYNYAPLQGIRGFLGLRYTL